jgi:chemotaxis protein methyltransferase CheR
MSDADFKQIRELVYTSCGIVLGEHKREMVYSRLSRRIRALSLASFSSYLEFLTEHKSDEFSHFINSITTNLTSFFREKHHFEYLENTLVPELISEHKVDKRIRIWSAVCSTGQEPYSISMTLNKYFPKGKWDLKILATDLDSNVLAKAKNGVYADTAIDGLDKKTISDNFIKSKQTDDVKVAKKITEYVSFKRLNLLENWPMKGPFDIIFCRNVVIYFDQETKERLFRRYAEMLKPGGYLFLGHSETLRREITEFEAIGQTIYRKRT